MSTRNCENCNAPCGPDDMFCESCGYDFITGSLPADDPDAPAPSSAGSSGRTPAAVPPAGVGVAPAAPSVLSEEGTPPIAVAAGTGDDPDGSATGPDVPRIRLAIEVDRGYFDEVVNDGEIDFPDPIPARTELELAGEELHIGRTSDSRAIHPDIDVADLTGDQAVSSRHAVLRVDPDGACSLVDVGSTNGTFLDAVDSEAIAQGVAVEVAPGTPIFLGAWTRITILT